MMRRRKRSGQRADEMGSEQVPLLVYSRTDEAFLLPRCRVYRRSSGMWGGTPPALTGSLFVDSRPFESTISCVNVIDMLLGDGSHILSIGFSRLQALHSLLLFFCLVDGRLRSTEYMFLRCQPCFSANGWLACESVGGLEKARHHRSEVPSLN